MKKKDLKLLEQEAQEVNNFIETLLKKLKLKGREGFDEGYYTTTINSKMKLYIRDLCYTKKGVLEICTAKPGSFPTDIIHHRGEWKLGENKNKVLLYIIKQRKKGKLKNIRLVFSTDTYVGCKHEIDKTDLIFHCELLYNVNNNYYLISQVVFSPFSRYGKYIMKNISDVEKENIVKYLGERKYQTDMYLQHYTAVNKINKKIDKILSPRKGV